MWHGNWLKLSEEFANVIDCGRHQHNVVADLKSSLWTFLTGVDKWYLRIRGLDPFLFGEAYSSSLLTHWAKEGNLLPVQGIIQDGVADKHTKQAVILVDTVIYHATLALHMLTVAASTCDVLRERFLQYQKICGELNQCFVLEDAMKCVARDELYHIVQKHASEGLSEKKMSAAAFLISYKLFDNMLETGDTNMMIKEFQDEWNAEAKKWKELGNEEYKDGQYLRAVASYTMAVKTNRYSAVLYGNRAQAYLKLGKLDEAELDGRRAVVLKPRWSKGYYRLAQAVEGQNKLHEAHCIASYGIKSCDEESASKDMLCVVEEKVGKKCKSEGYCSKKNKKGSRNEKIKNTSIVGDAINDIIDSNVENHWPSDVPELTDSDSNSDCSNDIVCDSVEEYNSISIEKLKNLLGVGSENLLAGRYQTAVECFETILGEINSSLDKYEKLDIEPLCLKYALGMSYVSSGFSEDIQKAIALFSKNLKDSDVEKFPAVYYGLGQAYIKINKFKEAEEPLAKCLQLIKAKLPFDAFMWPGSDHVIQETDRERLQAVVEELLEKCSNPPESDAVCRYEMCKLGKKIYYNDPDFKGICVVCCHDQCYVEYHPGCWKQLKELLLRTDKEFLGQNCLTPDCSSTIILVKLEDKYRTVVKQFEIDNAQKSKSSQKHRKNKLEKRFEQKERRKRKRQESHSSSKQTLEHVEQSLCCSEQETIGSHGENSQENCSAEKREEKNDNSKSMSCKTNKNKESAHLTYTTNSVPVCILKKNEGDLALKDQKVKKQKERKKQKSRNVMSIEEFFDGAEDFSVFNEYQQRIKRLEENKRMIEEGDNSWVDFCEKHENIPQLDPSRPFYVDKSLRDNPVALDAILQLCGGVGETEEMKSIRESVYSYMEDFLQFKGPVHKDDEILLNEIKNFSPETQELIVQSGGLEKFLLNSMNFAVANDYICLLSDVLAVYSLPIEKPTARYLDSLDTFDDFQHFESDSTLNEENGTSVDPTKSTLNPHASEYSPVQKVSGSKSSYLVEVNKELEGTDIPNDYCDEDLHIPNNCSNESKSKNEQPDFIIKKNFDNKTEKTSNDRSFCIKQNATNSGCGDMDPPGKDSNSSDYYKIGKDIHSIPCEEMPYQQLIEVIVSMLNRLSEYKMCQELTADILNKKLNCFQITLLGAKGKAIFPTVHDYAELQKNIACLEDEKEQLEQKLVENLDTITQLRKKHSLEIAQLQSSVEDSDNTQQELQKEIDELIVLRDTKNRQWQQERTKLQVQNKTLQDNLTSLSKELEALKAEKDFHIEKLQSEMEIEIVKKSELQQTIDSLCKKCEEQRAENLILTERVRKAYLPSNVPPPTPSNFSCFFPPRPFTNCIPPPPNFIPPSHPPVRSHLDVLFPPRPNHGRSGTFTCPPPGLEIPLRMLSEYTSRSDKDLQHPPVPLIPLPPSATKTCEAATPFVVESGTVSPPIRLCDSTTDLAKPCEPASAPLKNSDSVESLSFNSTEMPFSRPPSRSDETKVTAPKTDTAHSSDFNGVTTTISESYNKPTPITIVNWNSSIRNATDAKKPVGNRMPPKQQTDSQKNNSFEKLMGRLESRFPNISRKDLANSLKEYRAQHNNTLSGMTIDAIINGVAAIVRKNNKSAPTSYKLNVPNPSQAADEESLPAWTKRMAKMKPWCKKSSDCDNNCSICLEDMTPYVSFEVECGHSFHYKCIQEWLAKQSTCPICRIHVLLPDEFPALGQP